jgi:hypothetical protein
MKRRDFLYGIGSFAGLTAHGGVGFAMELAGQGTGGSKMVGMYVHQHWPYKHPYAARTWTVEDYRGYASALQKLGFNTLVIWPLLETMPDPLTASDKANLAKIGQVIDMLHNELGMRVMLTLCPNIVADNAIAAKASFESRHFFYSDKFIDPGDAAALQRMMGWRKQLVRPLARVDGVVIIDSDPGGYPGSTNNQFVNLLVQHRKMLDSLRPGIELYYWMHVGWQAYCRYYQTGKFGWGTPEESVDILEKLKQANPAPWGITIHTYDVPPNGTDLALAERFNVAATALTFNYGAIEAEPSFPMTNFGGNDAFAAGARIAPGGVVGNAQTHCVQLPNTYAFGRGASGKAPPTHGDYVAFANDLIQGGGETIVQGWMALAGNDAKKMRAMADQLAQLGGQPLAAGPLKGLLFGDPQRFVTDLVLELRMKGAYEGFVAASDQGQGVKEKLKDFVDAAAEWQTRTGYQCAWGWPRMTETLKKLRSPIIDAILEEVGHGYTPDEQIANHFYITETYTPRLIAALRKVSGGAVSS